MLIIYITVCVLLVCMGVMLFWMAIKVVDVYNRVLVFNHFSTQVVLFVTAMSIVLNNFFLLDIALLYASISFTSTIALMRLMLP